MEEIAGGDVPRESRIGGEGAHDQEGQQQRHDRPDPDAVVPPRHDDEVFEGRGAAGCAGVSVGSATLIAVVLSP